ncbi:MAG: hypothetical protein J5666_09245 [Bacilli bacterium]|nr:hypothetical protein [Bacilli bacterium]
MKRETISKILNRILNQQLDFKVEYFPYEESKGHYKNIYKIVTANKTYVLKKAKGNELESYKNINNISKHLSYFYGYYHYYNNDYILLEYVKGHNLMKMDRFFLIRTIDSIIDIQKKYWLSSLEFGFTKEQLLKSRYNRLSYLPDELKETYQDYLGCLKNIPVTFSHEDLLPFNVLINQDRVCFIDLEIGGILPYPTMLARLISHTKEDKDALFYLKKEDYDFAISYYYDNFIKEQGIDYQEYIRTMDLFILNELIEWIYVYKKNNYQPNDFYNSYYQKAIMKIEEIKRS